MEFTSIRGPKGMQADLVRAPEQTVKQQARFAPARPTADPLQSASGHAPRP